MARRGPMRRLPAGVRGPRFHRFGPWLVVAATGAVLVAVLGRHTGTPPARSDVGGDYERYHDRVATVVRVVDGDTIDIDVPDGRRETTRIRLWGVDTPEVAGSPRGPMYWGDRASAFAKRTLTGQRVRLELVEGRTRGKYKRLLAYVRLESTGEMFNEMLLRGGHAYADTRFAHPYMDRFVALEAEARAAGAGLWKNVTSDQMPGWRRRGR